MELKKDSANSIEKKNNNSKVSQEQIHGLLFSEQLSWQSIIYDLINTEQLDPWDIDLVLLASKYLEKIRAMEETNLFISSKVLFAASLLLRIKSEILLSQYIPDLDNILFGKEEERRYVQEKIEFDEEVPELVQRTPLPRFRKVTLQELITALGKAIRTENRRIKRVVTAKQQELETAIAIPKRKINIRDKIKEIYLKLKAIFSDREERLTFSELVDKHHNGDKIGAFIPLLHLDNQHKVFLEQDNHFDEIYIWLKHSYEKKNKDELEKMRKEVEAELSQEARAEELKEIEENLEDEEL